MVSNVSKFCFVCVGPQEVSLCPAGGVMLICDAGVCRDERYH